MRLGWDIDGVLADFNTRFIDRVVAVTGRDLFPSRPFDIPTWDYPQFYGYTEEETKATWRNIVADPDFWRTLPVYTGTEDVLRWLSRKQNDDVYFVTSRPGFRAKQQTERWLYSYGCDEPTVLISSAKGLCAQALDLTHYIDDRDVNVLDVAKTHPTTKVYLLDRPWNRTEVASEAISRGVRRVCSVGEMLDSL